MGFPRPNPPLSKAPTAITIWNSIVINRQRFNILSPEKHSVREQLSNIFEEPQTKAEAEQAIQAGSQRVREWEIKAFEPFLMTLVQPESVHLREITTAHI
jgi:hypothetical protein